MFYGYVYDEIVDGFEFELMTARVFSEIARDKCGLSEKSIKAISVLMSEHFIGESFDFNFFEEIFKQMGFV